MMAEVCADGLSFIYHYNKPSIRKDGIRYDILSIDLDADVEGRLIVQAIPDYGWCLKELIVDDSWRSTSWDNIARIVRRETDRLGR